MRRGPLLCVVAGALLLTVVAPVSSAISATPPSAPTAVGRWWGFGRVAIEWSPPADTGGLSLTGYVVQSRTPGTTDWTDLATTGTSSSGAPVSYTVAHPGLIDDYRVVAVTDAGRGAPGSPYSQPQSRSVAVGPVPSAYPDQTWGLLAGDLQRENVALEVDGHEHDSPSVSADGQSVLYSRAATLGAGESDFDIYRLTTTPADAPVRLTDLPGEEVDAEGSPDQSRIAFTHASLGLTSHELCVMPWAGTIGATPACLPGFSHPSWLTPTLLVASDDRTANGRILVIPVDPNGSFGAPTDLVAPSGAGDPVDGAFDPTVSQDRTRVAFVDGQGNGRIYTVASGVMSAPLFATSTVGTDTLSGPRWRDGQNVLFSRTSVAGDAVPALDSGGMYTPVPEAVGVPAPSSPVVPTFPAVSRPGSSVAWSASEVVNGFRVPLPVVCRFDDGPATPCSTGFTVPQVPDGGHRLVFFVVDGFGPLGIMYAVGPTITVDGTPPSAGMVSFAAPSVVSTSLRVWFYGGDALSGVASYDYVLTRSSIGRIPRATTQSGHVDRAIRGTIPAITTQFVPAQRVCVRARATDGVGNVGLYGAATCVMTPLDDRDVLASRGWRRTTMTRAYRHTLSTAQARGATLTTAVSLRVRMFFVVGMVGPGRGAVRVSVGRTTIGTVSFAAKKVALRTYLIALPTARIPSGRVTLTTTSASPVSIDALLVR